jgi:hypothetical protein
MVFEAAEDLGVSVAHVETNSSWFKDSTSAEAFLAGLQQQGLHTLLVSTRPFHNEHIRFSK